MNLRAIFINFKDILVEADHYKLNTIGTKREIPFALRPDSKEQIVEIIKLANSRGVKLYPISTGLNWGYGTSTPVVNGCIVLDLSKMDKILEIDEDLNFVRVEPGVTQEKLYKFFAQRGVKYLVPVTGAGPKCSIVGNLLERGYGITPHTDHFSSLLSLKAVLADGSIYGAELSNIGDGLVDKCFKWGIGPYVDGIFSQGNTGVVFEATISLVEIPEKQEMFVFRVNSEENLDFAVEAVRDVLQKYGSNLSGINLMNTRRMLSMKTPYFMERKIEGGCMDISCVRKLAKKYYCSEAWTGIGTIYGTKRTVKAFKKEVREVLKGRVQKLFFVNRFHAKFLKKLSYFVFGDFKQSLKDFYISMDDALDIFNGIPSSVALPLCYLKSKKEVVINSETDPAKDSIGLFWYSPLVPMKKEHVKRFVEHVESTCIKHGIEPLITLTAISERCFDSTIPILYDPTDNKEKSNAKNCYDELFDKGAKLGFFPYRFGVDHMEKIVESGSTFWKVAESIKKSLDPKDTISSGRYCKKLEDK